MKKGNIIFLLWLICGIFYTVSAFTIETGEDQTVFEGATTVLGGSPTASGGKEPYSYKWYQGNSSEAFSTEANPMITVLSGTNNYTLEVVDWNGISCSGETVVVVGLENQGGLSLLEIIFNTNHPVVDDKDNTIEYVQPKWTIEGDVQPVCYVSGETMSVSGKINIDPAIIDLPNVMLTGTATNGYEFLVNGNDLANVSGNTYEFSNILSEEAFPSGIVDFYYPLMIDWEISYNIGTVPTVGCIGMSENPVYVTAGVPDLLYPDNIYMPPGSIDGDHLYQTILHIGCEKPKGLSDVIAIVNSIYSEFQDQQLISIHDNIAYEYWGVVENWQNDPYTSSVGGVPNSLDAMLIYNKGRCGAFARLFSSAIKVHGIQGVENKIVYMKSTNNDLEIGSLADTYVYYNWIQQDYNEFLDKANSANIPINNENFYLDEFMPTQNGFEKQPLKNMFIKDMDVNGEKNFVFDIADVNGAQGNFKPRPYFQNHQIVKFDDKYYDPSYGTGLFNTVMSWEENSIEGFGVYGVYFNIDSPPDNFNYDDVLSYLPFAQI